MTRIAGNAQSSLVCLLSNLIIEPLTSVVGMLREKLSERYLKK